MHTINPATLFLFFIGFGGLLIAGGILLYVWTLLQWLLPGNREDSI